jgi:hypothetical protein
VPTASSPSDAVGRAVHVHVGRRQESAGLNELDDLDRSSAAARWLDRSARVRLDTRADLVEARDLYTALGYGEVPAFGSGRYAEHWFAKSLQ